MMLGGGGAMAGTAAPGPGAAIVVNAPITINAPGARRSTRRTHGDIGYRISEERRDPNISIEPSVRRHDTVFVTINAHHPIILPEPGFHQFDLAQLLRESMGKDSVDARTVLRCDATFRDRGKVTNGSKC